MHGAAFNLQRPTLIRPRLGHHAAAYRSAGGKGFGGVGRLLPYSAYAILLFKPIYPIMQVTIK